MAPHIAILSRDVAFFCPIPSIREWPIQPRSPYSRSGRNDAQNTATLPVKIRVKSSLVRHFIFSYMEILQILKTYQRSTMNHLSHTYDITRKESSTPRTTVTTYTRKYLSHLELLRFQETNSKEVPSFITVGRRAYCDPARTQAKTCQDVSHSHVSCHLITIQIMI